MGAAISLKGMKKSEFIPPQCPDYKRSETVSSFFFVVYITCTLSMMTVCMYTAPRTHNSSWLFNTNPLKADLIRNKEGNNLFWIPKVCCDGDKCPDSVVFLADTKDFLSPKRVEGDFTFFYPLWMKVSGFLEWWGMSLNIKGWSQVEYLSQTYQPRAAENAKIEASETPNLKLWAPNMVDH